MIRTQTLQQFFEKLNQEKEVILPLELEAQLVDNCINQNYLHLYPNDMLEILAALSLPNFQAAMFNLGCEYREVIMEVIALSFNAKDTEVKQVISNRIFYFHKQDQLKTLSLEEIDNLSFNYFLETVHFNHQLNLKNDEGKTQKVLKKLAQGEVLPELFHVYYEKALLENATQKIESKNSILKI